MRFVFILANRLSHTKLVFLVDPPQPDPADRVSKLRNQQEVGAFTLPCCFVNLSHYLMIASNTCIYPCPSSYRSLAEDETACDSQVSSMACEE